MADVLSCLPGCNAGLSEFHNIHLSQRKVGNHG